MFIVSVRRESLANEKTILADGGLWYPVRLYTLTPAWRVMSKTTIVTVRVDMLLMTQKHCSRNAWTSIASKSKWC